MNDLTNEEVQKGYRLLFDGESLNGWASTLNLDGWIVQNGSIVCKGERSGYLYTIDRFENFVLILEYKTAPKVNSGVFFRWSDLQDPVNTGLEAQILDTYDQDKLVKNSSGALYDLVAPSKNAVRKAGEWNQLRVSCNRNYIEIILNREVVVKADINQWSVAGKNPDGTDNKFKYAWRDQQRLGHIGLQDHGGYVEFRNIKVISIS
ncbi:3-keto-disaccharide hydrolase [Paenibacillus sp. UNC451MF]|uniref:3-keto-disaccharide hydrolase n=1 Tax=Paenibacillus sp. UNC451MF TaxID=1449063 RepID=UPI00048E633B|nr:DUF1080 domain-containing protein [Paenibacillus sp. UNC451MF]